MKPFVLVGGVVVGQDGQSHQVSAHDLRRLYGLPAQSCVFVSQEKHLHGVGDLKDRIVLRPREDGNYKLPPGVMVPKEGTNNAPTTEWFVTD